MTKAKARPRHGAHPLEKPHHPHWPLALLLFMFVAAVGFSSVHEPATWLHIRTGAKILAQRAIPAVDPFSYTVSGRAWTTDSWLGDVLFYVVHEGFGPRGLILLKSMAAALGFSLLLPLNYASPLTSATVLALGAVAAWTGLTEVPAVFDLLMLAAFIRLLRPRRPFHFMMLLQAGALEWAWVNIHGSTAVLGLWMALLKAYKATIRTTDRSERLGHWGLLGVVFFALVVNPQGAGVMARLFSGSENLLTAWQPTSPWLNLYNFFFLAGAASCLVVLQQEFLLSVTAASVLCLSVLAPNLRALAILACCPVISLALGHVMKPVDDDLTGLARWGVVMAGLLGLHWLGVTVPLGGSRGYGVVSLKGATGFLKSNGVRGRMFNEIESGAMLIGAGDRPVFVDERAALYGEDFMRDAARWPEGFKGLADVYGFDYAVLLNRRASYPARVLDNEPDWYLAYSDDVALVYIKRGGASGWLVKERAQRLTRPNRLWPDMMNPALEDARVLPRLVEELDRWILDAPDSVQAQIWKAYALDRRGLGASADRLLELTRLRRKTTRDPELCAMLAFAMDARGETAPAQRFFRRAALLARRRREAGLEAEILSKLAVSYHRSGDAAQAAAAERRARLLSSGPQA